MKNQKSKNIQSRNTMFLMVTAIITFPFYQMHHLYISITARFLSNTICFLQGTSSLLRNFDSIAGCLRFIFIFFINLATWLMAFYGFLAIGGFDGPNLKYKTWERESWILPLRTSVMDPSGHQCHTRMKFSPGFLS